MKKSYKYDWSEDRLRATVGKANCWYRWLDELNIPRGGRNCSTLKYRASKYGIDTSHFGYVYAKTHNGGHKRRQLRNLTEEEAFSPVHDKRSIKKEYIKRILKGKSACEVCGIKDWQGKPLVLQIHHIDGNIRNQKPSNLKLLCPNCHSQTENYGSSKE